MEILEKVTVLKAELDGLRPFDKDREAAIMQKLRLDWNFHSNHLEGNSLTFGETKALILFGITAAGKPLKDHFEMTGHDEAVKWVEDVVKESRPLTETFVRELHKLILKEPYESPTITPEGIPAKRTINVGVYKTAPNHVLTPTGEIFRFATPEETPAMMHDLIEWYRQKESNPETHPLLLAAEFHYKFIRIHPFDDGNGRTARILMNFILMKHGYPPVIIKTEDKAKYIAALQQSDAGIITPFIEYIGQNLAHSLDIMIRGAKGENIDEPDDVDKEIALIERKLIQFNNRKKKLKPRSKEVITEIYKNSIKPLFLDFVKQNNKFKKFYSSTSISIQIDSSHWFVKKAFQKKFDEIANERVTERTRQIGFSSEFIDFKNEKVHEFSFGSQFEINFRKTEYEVSNDKNTLLIGGYEDVENKNEIIENFGDKYNDGSSIVKGYDEFLSKEEIFMLLQKYIRAHLDLINQQIELAQKKSKP